MYKFVFLALLALVLFPSVSAQCLSIEEEDALIDMALSNNQSPSLLTNIFENLCERSYTTDETDDLINELNISSQVRREMDNYTEWIDERLEINQYLNDMVIIMNASSSIQDFDDRLEIYRQSVVDQLDEQIGNFKEDYATKDFVSGQLSLYESENVDNSPKLGGWEVYALIAFIVAVLAWVFKDQLNTKLPKGNGPPLDRQSFKAHSFNLPGMKKIKEEVMNVKQKQPTTASNSNPGRKGQDIKKI